MNAMPSNHSMPVVGVSLAIAMLAAYLAFELAQRVREADPFVARCWWFGGSLVMGTGIWAMHFVGMSAFSLPIPLGYRSAPTVLSWVAAVLASALALRLAVRRSPSQWRFWAGAGAMGGGVCSMHYLGMAALDMAPGIVWDRRLVALSVVMAVVASAVALRIFAWLPTVGDRRTVRCQAAAALALGLAIAGMHYVGMAAARFPAGSVCLSVDALTSRHIGGYVVLATLLLLIVTLLMSMLDARLRRQAMQSAQRLQQAKEECEHANGRLHQANAELLHRASHDPLTNCLTRASFEDRLQHAVQRHRRLSPADQARPILAVLFVDLDGFWSVNDSYGHLAGDALLQEAAQRLRTTVREIDSVTRIGGDEFVLLGERLADPADAVTLAERIKEVIGQPYQINSQSIHLSASIGIAICGPHDDGGKLLAHADAAMYAAKHRGGNCHAVYEPHMDAGTANQMRLQVDLRAAIEQGQLSLHYQPKIDARRGTVCGVEALLRWQHPERGAIGPNVFIPIAERHGLINELGDWVVTEACRQMRAWESEGLRVCVAINLSVYQLRQKQLAGRIATAMRRYGLAADRLLCEITESVAMDDIKMTLSAFENLRRIGVSLSIDDFGTGYSSLSYLRQLPVHQLKIDRSFVHDLEESKDARAIVDAVVHLAHALGLRVVAEGVETEGQQAILCGLGCDELQGYRFARPMPPDALLRWVPGRVEPAITLVAAAS